MQYTTWTIFNYIMDNYDELLGKYYDLTADDKLKIMEANNKINRSELYSSFFHGLYHSQKVLLFAYILGKESNLNDNDMKIILDAAIYHDVGRSREAEDTIHGYGSAMKLKNILKDDFYKDNPNYFSLLQAIVNNHSRYDGDRLSFDDFDIDDDEYDHYIKLSMILNDANYLDRVRFPKISPAFIESKFLKTNASKELITLSCAINYIFRNCVDNLNYNHYLLKYGKESKDNVCFHGIGWDFSKLESILENGIVSQYVANQNSLSLSRNYNGNNSNMWISVVDSRDIAKNGDCLKKFINGNITFCCFVGKYCEGVEQKYFSTAFDNGLPINSGLYDDEKFVFGCIPIEDVYSIILPKDSLELLVKNLNFLNCATNYEIIESRVMSYLKYIENICHIKVDVNLFKKHFDRLKSEQINFSKLSDEEQKIAKDNFFAKIEKIVDAINGILREIINDSFKLYFKKDDDICVQDIIKDIFERHNISYQKLDAEEVIYCLDNQKRKN